MRVFVGALLLFGTAIGAACVERSADSSPAITFDFRPCTKEALVCSHLESMMAATQPVESAGSGVSLEGFEAPGLRFGVTDPAMHPSRVVPQISCTAACERVLWATLPPDEGAAEEGPSSSINIRTTLVVARVGRAGDVLEVSVHPILLRMQVLSMLELTNDPSPGTEFLRDLPFAYVGAGADEPPNLSLTSGEHSYVMLHSPRFVPLTLQVLADHEGPGAVLAAHQVRALRKCQVMDGELYSEMFGYPPEVLSDDVVALAEVCRSLGAIEAGSVMAPAQLDAFSTAMKDLLATIELLRAAPYTG